MSENLKLAERFFKAIEQSDIETVRQIYAPDAVIWHNYDGDYYNSGDSVEDNLVVLKGLASRILGAHYDIIQREETLSGFVQQHVLRGELINGEAFELRACIIVTIKDGRITRLDEYFDTKVRDHLYKVIAAHEVKESSRH